MDYSLLFEAYTAQHGQQGWSRQRLLHACLRSAIRQGTLAAGTALAPSRALAEELGVARNTVLYAYEQLASEGFVQCDRRGTVVAAVPLQAAALQSAVPLAQAGLSQRMSNLRLSPPSAAPGGTPPPAGQMGAFVPGVPALDQFPLAAWRRLLERAWRSVTPAQLNYGDPAGEWPLRVAIADHLRAARGVVCDATQVFITDGTQSSLDLCLRALADVGDTIWIEHPGYAGALAAARGASLNVTGIEVDEEGIAPQPDDWLLRPPRLIYTTPSHQYPLGSVLSLRRRVALLDAARRAAALIIEDDYDSEFRHDGAPLSAMQGLAPDAPVVYLGTFSKTMFPSLRIGFVVVPATLVPGFAQMRAHASARGRVAEQLALAEFLHSGQFARHVRRMRRLYRQRRDALVAAVEQHLGARVTLHGVSAGMHLVLCFKDASWRDEVISQQLLAHGIVAEALSAKAVQGALAVQGLVLGYAQVPAEQMDVLIRRMAALLPPETTAAARTSRRSQNKAKAKA